MNLEANLLGIIWESQLAKKGTYLSQYGKH